MVRVSKVSLEAIDGAKASHGVLGSEADEGKHGEASVLDLLLSSLGAVHAGGVEEGAVLLLLPSIVAEGLKDSEGGDLNKDQGLGVKCVLESGDFPELGESSNISEEDSSDSSHSPKRGNVSKMIREVGPLARPLTIVR